MSDPTADDLAQRVLAAPPSVGGVRLVLVDGPAGAGKTTLAAALGQRWSDDGLAVPVLHGDEVYEGWPVVADAPDRVAAFGILARRLAAQLADAWCEGRDAVHPRWDWHGGRWSGQVVLPPAPVVVLEGVGLGAAPLRELAALRLWVECDPRDALPRVLARDGEAVRGPMTAWQADEAAWHTIDATRDAADVRLTT